MMLIKKQLLLICFELEMIANFGKRVYWSVTIKMYRLENQCGNHFYVFEI